MKTRIVDIARLAQVSSGTVDRVIHKRGEVSEKTREKVERIIKELDYQPDILARALSKKKDIVFFVLIPVSVNENEFWAAPLKGIEKALKEISHYGVKIKYLFFNQFDIQSFICQSDKIIKGKADGLIFAPVFAKESAHFLSILNERSMPVILINSMIELKNGNCFIGQDSIQSGYLAGRLISYGMQNNGDVLIVNISARKDNYEHILRRERGFRKYFSEKGLKGIELYTIELMQASREEIFLALNKEFHKRDFKAVFVTNSRVFLLAEYLKMVNRKDLILLGYDLLPESVDYLKDGTVDFLISQRPEEQGYRGVMALFTRVLMEQKTDKLQYLPIDIITKENIEYYKFR